MRVISYGGGVQSTALVVLAVQGKIGHVDAGLFSNVGDDSEHPDTLTFVREIAIPYAATHGLTIHELQPTRKNEPITLYGGIMADRVGDAIPVFGEAGNPMRRVCTADFKIKTVHRWLKNNGVSKDNPATVCLGISTDEIERAGRGVSANYEVREYPLLTLGLNRTNCEQIIRQAGLPVPPKSSCFFCPFHSETVWAELRRDHPDLFDKAQVLEDHLQSVKSFRGLRQVYLTRRGAIHRTRLSDTVSAQGPTLFGSEIGSDGCDSGFCWT